MVQTTYHIDARWTVSTIIMASNLALCITMAIVTKLAANEHKQRLKAKKGAASSKNIQSKQEFMAYFVYGFAALCILNCILCHYSLLWYGSNADTFCRWASPVCLVIFFTAKSFLYGFFLERAKISQGLFFLSISI